MDFLDEIFESFETSKPPTMVKRLPLGEAIWPWIGYARKKVQNLHLQLFENSAFEDLELSLLKKLSTLVAPSMVLELGISRYSQANRGKTPKAKYNDFLRRVLWHPQGLRSFFNEYSELKRMVETTFHLWEEQSHELIDRIVKDYEQLCKLFNKGKKLGKVTHLNSSLGDSHKGGRTVYQLSFTSGKKVVYKPKESGIANAFNELLEELNSLGHQPKLKGYQVLACDHYGWEEHVECKECNSIDEIKRFYRRAGSLLCLAYLLDGNDFHQENLIASGEFPFLIDLETLFHAEIPVRQNLFENIVLKTGLLPSFTMGAMGKKGIDISGLGSSPNQLSPMTVPVWKKLNTEEMHLVYEERYSKGGNHGVRLNGKWIHAEKFVEEIVSGFSQTYDFILKNKEMVQRHIEKMTQYPVRYILRATRFYGHLLQRLRDPQVVLHQEQREKELSNLTKYLIEKGLEELHVLVTEEIKSLLQGDIPFFYAYPNKRDIYCNGKIVLKNIFGTSASENVMKRLQTLSNDDRALQETFIRRSFSIKKHFPHSSKKRHSKIPQHVKKVGENDLWNEALKIGKRLKEQRFNIGEELNWIDLEPDPLAEQFQFHPISDTLYGGRLGIALFFAALAKKDPSWKKEALEAIAPFRKKIHDEKADRIVGAHGLGGFTGVGSFSYTLFHMGQMLKEPKLIDEAHHLLNHVEERHIEEDQLFDLIGGSSGLILSASTIYQTTKEKRLLEIIERCGKHLVKHSLQQEKGIGWCRGKERALLGLSHGVAGTALALFKAAALTQDHTFHETACGALEYERHYFNPKEKNWPHLGEKMTTFRSGWCHGATGIGMARLHTKRYFNDGLIDGEIEAALEQTKVRLYEGPNPTLCCSSLGRLEFIVEAGEKIEDEISTIVALVMQTKREYSSPGLMQGDAGIGYTYLRLLDPSLPQVLLLN